MLYNLKVAGIPKRYDVAIIGAGPAGLFAAYKLASCGVKNIAVIEKGSSLEKRKRSKEMFGVGGAGLYSDGKLILSPVYGKTNLLEFVSREKGEKIIDEIENVFYKTGFKEKAYPRDWQKAKDLKTKCQKYGINMYLVRQLHLGSDNSIKYINGIVSFLVKNKVKIITNTEIASLEKQQGKISAAITTKGEKIKAKYFLAAPGRPGNIWFTKQAEKLGLNLEHQPIEVGVRIEFPKEIIAKISKVIYEPALYFYTETYDDYLRTFCVVPNGFVAIEHYKNFVCVNGHGYKNKNSLNGNMAILVKVSLSQPTTNTTEYGESICELANTIGNGKPILQRYVDFKRHRRSTWERLEKAYTKPTLTDVTPGDIGMALPHRIVTNLEEGIEKINKIIPGIASGSTLLYAPEVKFYSARIKTNAILQTEIRNLFAAGDGAGVSGNIVGAAATGIIAAEAIARKI